MKNKVLAFLLPLAIASTASALQRNYFRGGDNFGVNSDVATVFDSEYYDNIVNNNPIWDLTFEQWYNGPHALGGLWGGRNSLDDMGIVPVFSYIGNFAANPDGGRSRGASLTSSVNLGLGVDLQKITSLKELEGWSIGNTWVWRFGDSLTKDRIGNTFNVQQNYGSQTIRLHSLFLQYIKTFDEDWQLRLKFGRFAAGDNFLTKPIYWLYQNNAFDGNPVGIFNQTKWSAYPGSTWAAAAQIKYKDGQYFRAGVFQINTDRQDSVGMHGLDWSFHGEGVNANFEGGWDINHDDSGRSPGNISVGIAADWYNAQHNDNPSAYSPFNCTVYIQADYMVYNMGFVKQDEPYYLPRKGEKYRDLRGIILWGVFQYDPYENLAYMPYFANGGILFNAPFKSCADDVLCFGAAYGKYSADLRDKERGSYEIALELNYKLQINRFSFLQPNIQYIINTKGGEYPNALVLGMQFGLNL